MIDWYKQQEIELIYGSDPLSWRYIARYPIPNHPLKFLDIWGVSSLDCVQRLIECVENDSHIWAVQDRSFCNGWYDYFNKGEDFDKSLIQVWHQAEIYCTRIQ